MRGRGGLVRPMVRRGVASPLGAPAAGSGGGGGTPAWVAALAAPSADLPTDALVFTDGHYWSNGTEQAVTALLGGGGYAGNFDPSAISASGMACLVGNANRPLAAGDLLTSFTTNYLGTYVARVIISEIPADTPDLIAGNIMEFFGNDADTDPLTLDWYTTDAIGTIAWEAANTDYGSFDVVATGPGNAAWNVAFTLKPNGDVVSSWGGGAAQTDAASQANAGPPTKVSIGFADTSVMSERSLRGSILSLVRYNPQPDADLPALSA